MADPTRPRLEAWVRSAPLGRGRWMAALGGFLAMQTLSLLLVAELQARTADPDPALVLFGFVAGLTGLLLCGAGLPLMAHARRVRKWRQRYLLQLQDARAWFVQGRLRDEQLAAARGPLEEAAEGRFPGETRRTAGDVLRRTGLLAAAWAVPAGLTAWRLAGPSATILAVLAAAAAVAGVLLVARGLPLWRAGKAATTAHLAALAEAEQARLAAARDGRASGPEPR